MTAAANRSQATVATAPPTSPTADRELVATRVFDAPRALVFKLWTTPEHLGKWWGPRGFTTTTYAMDFRPGGAWRYCMHGPDGTDYQNRVTFTEIVEGERIAFRHGGSDDVEPVGHESIATFEDLDGKTKVTMRLIFPTAEQRELIVKKYGAAEGLVQTIDRLAEVATERAGTRTNALTVSLPSDLEFRLTRTFDAPRALVWEAMTRPEHLARWWGPRGSTVEHLAMDFRPGGAWRFVLRTPDGKESPFKGVYREIVPPERVVQTFIYDVDVIRDFEAVETLTLTEHRGKTTIAVTVRHQTPESRDGHLYSGMEAGAGQSYDRLAELLATMA
jgi:uncharacterized protein YndB with AHSA1/START domain